MLARQERTLDQGYLLASVLGRSRGWNLPTGVLLCAPSLWTQLTAAGHEMGMFTGVLPRLKVVLVFPTRALVCEGLALRCNSNKSPNHLNTQMTGTKDAIIVCSRRCRPGCAPQRIRPQPFSRGHHTQGKPARQLSVAVSVGAWEQGAGLIWLADCHDLSNANSWGPAK